MKENSRLPDFLIIGAGKSGTTALFYFLAQHPKVFIPKHKEPNFFALEGVDVDSYEFEESKTYHLRSIDRLDKYLELFTEAEPDQKVGENSNMYLFSESAIEKIKKYTPQARLIAIIRHPAERLISRYAHLVRENDLPPGGVEAIFDRSSIWWRRPDLLPEGFYGEYLERYYKNFPSSQIKVILYDDFKANDKKVIKDLYDFIGVPSDFEPDTEIVLNKSGKLKDNTFNKFLGQNGFVIRSLRRMLPFAHRWLKKNMAVKKVLTDWRNKNIEAVDLPADLKQRITEDIYKEDILKLEKVLGRSLQHWYK